MFEAARDRERFSYRRQIVFVFGEFGADGVDVAKRCKEFESVWEQAFTLEQLQQSSCAGVEDTFAHRWKHDCSGVDQQLCARCPREPLLAKRVEAVAVRTRRDP